MVMNMADGVYTYTFNAEKRPDCVACSNTTRVVEIEPDATLQTIYDKLCEDPAFLMKSPGLLFYQSFNLFESSYKINYVCSIDILFSSKFLNELYHFTGITTVINGRNKTLYMSSIKSIEERTRDNLKKKVTELGLFNGADILVADVTTPNTVTIKLKFSENQDVDMTR